MPKLSAGFRRNGSHAAHVAEHDMMPAAAIFTPRRRDYFKIETSTMLHYRYTFSFLF